MNLKNYLSKKAKLTKANANDWLPFCTLDVSTGALWAGDPHMANAEDGCVAKVPPGRYVVEGIGAAMGRDRFVSKLRVRLETEKNPTVGKPLGDTGTDSAMIAVCDIKAFDKAIARVDGEAVQEAIEAQTDPGFGIIKLKKFPGAIMPFLPTGSDGGGPVLALMSGRKRVGIELSFAGEEETADVKPAAPPSAASLSANDRDRYITRLMADGSAASFWLGGELKANEQFSLWSNAAAGPIDYRIRSEGKSGGTTWSPLKKGDRTSSGFQTLGPGKHEIDFRIGEEIYSALKLDLA